MPTDRTDRLIIAALLLLNLVLKCSWLGADALSNDEPFTVYWSQRPWSALWPMLATENNPPLYFLLIKAWSAWVPFEAAWLRVPAAVCSALVVVPLYLLGHGLGHRRAGLIAALVFTFCNYHFGYAHEVRAYALFTLLATVNMWLLVRERSGSGWRAAIVLGAVNALMVYTHFFGWLMVGVQLAVLLALPNKRRNLRTYAKALAITVLAYLPYASVFLSRMGQSVTKGTWLERPPVEEIYNMLWRWSNAPVMVVLFLAIIVLASLKDRLRSAGLRVALTWTFVPLFGMFLASFAAPMFLDRYLVYAAPGFALLVGVAAHIALPKGTPGHWLGAVPVLGMLITFTPWKGSGRAPEKVVAQAETWCAADCRMDVRPSWYRLNYNAAKDIGLLKDTTALHGPNDIGLDADQRTMIVVDAGADMQDPDRSWYRELRADHPHVDSVLADKNVWVYRFRR